VKYQNKINIINLIKMSSKIDSSDS